MSGGFVAVGVALVAVLLVGYFGQRHLPPPKPTFIGIDLGTTFSCVGAYQPVSGNVTIFQTDQGTKCIPSVIAVLPWNGTVLVGKTALDHADRIPSSHLIYDAKRFIGRSFVNTSDNDMEQIRSRYPFVIKLTDKLTAFFEVNLSNGSTVHIYPEDVGAHILSYLRKTANNHLQRTVSRAVMSVPAEFDQEQRKATKDAAERAGLDVRRVIQEPTAAAMAYGLHEQEGIQMVIVVDLGGGTLDVSLLNRQGGMFITVAIAGNSYLGGQDFTHRLLNYMLLASNYTPPVPLSSTQTQYAAATSTQTETERTEKATTEQLSTDHKNTTSVDQATLQALRLLAEQVKIDLTDSEYVHINIDIPVQMNLNITRQKFSELNNDLFSKVLRPIEVVLEEASLTPDQVDEIVLVGGSTRVPKVRQVIGDFFSRDLLHHSTVAAASVDPQLAVVTGVSVQAGILGGMWPLQVSAIEVPMSVRKVHVL